MRTTVLPFVFFVVVFIGSYGFSQSLMEQLRNLESGGTPTVSSNTELDRNSDFNVDAQLDRSDRTYVPGESLRLKIKSEKAGHLYIACESDGETHLIFPNAHAKENQIAAGTEYLFPASDAPFAWRIQGKPGTKESLIILVAESPMNLNGLDINALANQKRERFATNRIEVVPNFKVGSVTIEYNIVDKRSPTTPTAVPSPPSSNKKRVAMIFTQTHMIDQNSHKLVEDNNCKFRVGNAIHVGNVLKKYGGIEGDVALLYKEDFNKRKIKEAFAHLARTTNSGDEIFIYWESHGTTGLRDTTGREQDGKNECLCMVDFHTNGTEGYILDDEFADMLGVFKDRRVMILMEACHSGGLLESSARNTNRSVSDPIDWLTDENFRRVCKGDIDYSDFVSKTNHLINFSTLHNNTTSGSEISLSSFVRSSERTQSSGGLLDSIHALTGGAKGDTSAEHTFITNVASRLAQTMSKDVDPQTPNLAIIFSCSKNERSFCQTFDTNGAEIELPDSEGTKRLISAPAYSLVRVMTSTDGNLTANRDRALFDDVWNFAKELIPVNAARIIRGSGRDDLRDSKQIPVYMNTIKDICVRPEEY